MRDVCWSRMVHTSSHITIFIGRTEPEAQLAALGKTIDDEFKQTGSNYLFLPVGFDFSSPQANLMSLVDRWNASNKATALVISDPDSAFQYLATRTTP